MLGGYGVFGSGAYVEKTFDLSGAPPHSAVWVQLDFVKIDRWGGDSAYLTLNGELAWTQSFAAGSGDSSQCGGSDYNQKEQLVSIVAVDAVLYSSASSLTLRVDTDLNPKQRWTRLLWVHKS